MDVIYSFSFPPSVHLFIHHHHHHHDDDDDDDDGDIIDDSDKNCHFHCHHILDYQTAYPIWLQTYTNRMLQQNE